MMERTVSWSNIGTEVNTKNFGDVLTKAGLDYTVSKTPIFTTVGETQIPIENRVAITRDTDNHVYNVMSSSYTPIQNAEAFDFINYIDEDIEFVKAGETKGGMIYIIGQFPKVDILGDEFTPHVIFQNSHNGRYHLAMSICPLRMVCQNQFNIAFKESNSTFNIRHTKNITSKLEMATEALSSVSHYMKTFGEKAEMFAKTPITETRLTTFLNFMFPTNEEMSPKLIEQVEEEKRKFIKIYNNEDNQNFKGSAWGLINGLTDYITHQNYKRKVENADEKKFVETIVIANKLNGSMNFLNSLIA